jgi:hypothetical protein
MVKENDDMVDTSLPWLSHLTYREWHAFVEGVYCGAEDVEREDYNQEKHYWRVGYLIGKKLL